jgi:hypothetical protein
MRKVQQFANRITNWEMFNSNLKPFLPELPFLQAISTEMETLIAAAKTLDSEQELTRGRLQEIIHQRQDLEKRGEDLRNRATSHLKGTFGFSSDSLVKFGVRPRKTGPRGPRKAKQPTATPAPASQE